MQHARAARRRAGSAVIERAIKVVLLRVVWPRQCVEASEYRVRVDKSMSLNTGAIVDRKTFDRAHGQRFENHDLIPLLAIPATSRS